MPLIHSLICWSADGFFVFLSDFVRVLRAEKVLPLFIGDMGFGYFV